MSRLEELIAEYCPDGVKYKKVRSICTVLRGKRLTTKELLEDGKYPVIHGGTTPMGYYDKANRKAGTTIVINTGNAGCVFYIDKEFWSSDACFSLYPCEEILDRFLFFFVSSKEKVLKGKIRAGAMPTIDSNAVENLTIPVPPLPVQCEIVRILDNFTELAAELTAELTARKKQYEYYLETAILSCRSAKKCRLSEVCSIYDGTHQTPEYRTSGVRFVSVENIDDLYGSEKYISQEAYDRYKIKPQINDVLMTRITAGIIGKCTVIDRTEPLAYYVSLALLRPNPEVLDSRYLKYYIESGYGKKELRKYILTDATPPKINKDAIGKVSILLPSIDEQRRIVSTIQHFDAYCTDLTAGLPAEIEARQKQYEYYRDKLLTFKEL